MARYTTAYSSFVGRTDEVLILVRKAAHIERSAVAFSHGREIDALCRGAIVLLSSHIEAFVKELGECLLDGLFAKGVCRSKLDENFFYHASRKRLDTLRKEMEPKKLAGSVFDFLDSESDLWSKFGSLPRAVDSEEFSKGFANPKVAKVQKYLARFGYDSFRHDLNVALKADCAITTGMVDHIVETRNSIAHGEISATKTPAEVGEMVRSSQKFCRTIDAAFASWCVKNLCSIR